ncbi:MAG: hypothetical protein WA797_03615 [Acidimicrobiales bacterium]
MQLELTVEDPWAPGWVPLYGFIEQCFVGIGLVLDGLEALE